MKDLEALKGIYTCSLSYGDVFLHLVKNQSLVFVPRKPLSYEKYANTIEIVSEGDSWSESCEADGWPLPSLQWYFNNKPVSNITIDSSVLSQVLPYYRTHRANTTHLNSHLIIRKVSKAIMGRFSCVLNGNQVIRNVTLKLTSSSSDSDTKNEDDSKSSSPDNCKLI
jgi:hypothetical protein